MIGAVGECFDPGAPLSEAVRGAVDDVIGAILGELWRLAVRVERKTSSVEADAWWAEELCTTVS